MKAVRFEFSLPRYVVGKALGGFTSSVTLGALSALKLREVPEPALPGPAWARLRVLAAGICGTDISTFTYHTSPLLEPFASFPCIPGHEVLARVEEVGPQVRGVAPGDQVVVDPMLSCRHRGYPDKEVCPSCRAGYPSTCGNAGEDGPLVLDGQPLSRGFTIGYHRHLPGGWGEIMVAHQDQLFRVPEEVGEKGGVLVEPLSIGLHAALNTPAHRDEPILVIGSGPIAMGAAWALRASGFTGEVVVQAKRSGEAKVARSLGASQVIRPGDDARDAMVATGARAYQPIIGPEVYAGGGFPLIYDCVGSPGSLDQALRYMAPRGRIVLLGCAGQLRKVDLTFLWAKEVEVKGFLGYGTERWEGEERHTFQVTMEALRERTYPVEDLVTHVYPLGQFRDALRAAANRRRSGAMKVVLKP